MSYYDNSQWSATGASTWDHQTPPARSGASSAVPREESAAFVQQFEEVDRATENLFKSGKTFSPLRRESMPMGGGRDFVQQYDPRLMGGSSRHHSVSEFGGEGRSYSASNLQNFYATQRHQPSRASEAEQVMQAKRRMAAQRERELRNYHQEQQYNRSVLAEIAPFSGKSDRAMSPGSGMSEEERRELIAHQRSALYGEGTNFPETGSFDESGAPRPATQNSNTRGQSPRAFDNGSSEHGPANAAQPTQSRSRANSTSSPASNPTNFNVFDTAAQQSSRTSNSSPGGSPPRAGKAAQGSSVAPIGTRPNAGQAPNPGLSKRSTTPLPSPLSFGFGANDDKPSGSGADRSTSAASNPSGQEGALGWGSKSGGVWGKGSLGVQASVWG